MKKYIEAIDRLYEDCIKAAHFYGSSVSACAIAERFDRMCIGVMEVAIHDMNLGIGEFGDISEYRMNKSAELYDTLK